MSREPADTAPPPAGDEPEAAGELPALGIEASPEAPVERPVASAERGNLLRRVFLWPLRRFFDPRLTALSDHVSATARDTRNHLALVARDYHELGVREQGELRDELRTLLLEIHRYVAAHMDASVEASTFVGQALEELSAQGETVRAEIAKMAEGIDGTGSRFELLQRTGLEGLDAATASFLNYANSHGGFASERNLWFNWPISLLHEEADVRVGNVNERIVETAYAFRALAGVEPGSAILDVGATESPLALSLASLGFRVTALDPRPYPLHHPHLEVVVGGVEELEATAPRFAAVLCISTLEHIGSGEYGQASDEDADAQATRKIHALTEPDGLLVLTVPFGPAARTDEGGRVYDREQLERLLTGWQIADFSVVRRVDETTWLPAAEDASGDESVALVTARRSQ
jgi:hypothetical protein